jgi:hypothetical protein
MKFMLQRITKWWCVGAQSQKAHAQDWLGKKKILSNENKMMIKSMASEKLFHSTRTNQNF